MSATIHVILEPVTVVPRAALGKKRRLSWAIVSWCWIILLTDSISLAQSTPPTSAGQLLVSPGATCLDPTELTRRLTEWLGKGPLDASLRIEVHGDPQRPRKLSFALFQRGHKRSERRFEDSPADCAQLHAVVSLAMAIAVRDTLLEDLGVREATEQDNGRLWRAELAGLLGTGFGPGLNGGLALGLSATVHAWFEVRVELLGILSQQGHFSNTSGSYDLSLAGASLQACAHAGRSARIGVRLCTGPLVGALFARGHGYERSLGEAGAYLAWLGRTDLLLNLTSRWALTLGMLGGLPIVQPDLLLRDAQQRVVRRKSLEGVGIVGTLGLALTF